MIDERWKPEEYKQGIGDILGLYSSAFFRSIGVALGMLPEHCKVLDVGCAGGKWGATMALLRCNVTLMDKDQEMLDRAHKNFPYIKMNDICSSIMDVENVPDDFNLVMSDGLVEHFLDKETRIQVLKNMYSRISTGFLVFTVPVMSGAEDEHQYVDKKEIFDEITEAFGDVPVKITDINFDDGRVWTVSLISKIL